MTYRILNQAPQYLLPDGSVNAGGSLTFFEPDLSTPKNTWSDPDMVTLNANPVLLDSAGRTVTVTRWKVTVPSRRSTRISYVVVTGGQTRSLPWPVRGKLAKFCPCG